VRSVVAVGQHGGFVVSARCGRTDRSLASARGGVRLFPNLTTLAALLRKFGISCFEVDTANYEPGRVRPARPDRAEALRRTRTRPKQANFFEGEI
jgi:hypothetical protein